MLTGTERVTLVLGNFGSGKTEVAVNLALRLADAGRPEGVTLADLDLVNPYFRSREPRELMRARGVHVVIPGPQYLWADLPILLPEVRALIMASTSYAVIDVGGDDAGARVLGSLADALSSAGARALMVINAKRPFTNTVEGILRIKREIEEAGRLSMTGLVANTHFMDETDLDTVMEGYRVARETAAATGLPIEFVCAPARLADRVRARVPEEVLAITRHLAPSWRREEEGGGGEAAAGGAPLGKALFKL